MKCSSDHPPAEMLQWEGFLMCPVCFRHKDTSKKTMTDTPSFAELVQAAPVGFNAAFTLDANNRKERTTNG